MDIDTNVIGRLSALANSEPSAPCFTFLDGRGRVVDSSTRAQLLARVESMSGFVRLEAGIEPGERTVLVYPPSLDFVVAVLGCLYAGVVPVPVYPPNPFRLGHDLEGFRRVVSDCGARVALSSRLYGRGRTVGRLRAFVTGEAARWPADLKWFETDRARGDNSPAMPGPASTPDSLALLQYTSGSTSAPKGVMITHENIAHQLAFNAQALNLDTRSVAVIWVPQYHDFGLISGVLSSAWGNGHLVFFSPLEFIRRPALWLELLSRHRATHTAAPNFAYELAVRKTSARQRASWDLSSLEVIMSAAEPVRASTIARFCEAFAVSRLRPEAFSPSYGLAEHTVGVTVRGRSTLHLEREQLERSGRALATAPGAGRAHVGCGVPTPDIHVRIVDPESARALPPGEVGEIWVDSPSKAAGYWNRPELTRQTFRARIADDASPRTYLRTGDMGFVGPEDGELYICGRRKDLVIVGGRNVHPQDVELTVERAHAGIRPGCVACFADADTDPDAEHLVVVAELAAPDRCDPPAVVAAIRAAIGREQLLRCRTIVLIEPRTIAKTTSGKIQRAATRERWRAGALAVVHAAVDDDLDHGPILIDADPDSGPTSALREQLIEAIANELGRPAAQIDGSARLTDLGVSSVVAASALRRFEASTGLEVPLALALEAGSLDALAAALAEGRDALAPGASASDSELEELVL